MAKSVDVLLRKTLRQLETERERLDRKIAAVRSALGAGSGPGAHSGAVGSDGQDDRRARKRRPMSAARKKAQSARMKKYWAETKKVEGKGK